MKKWTLIIAIILVSGCARTVFVNTPLPIPEEPEYIALLPDELECLSDSAYTDLVIRQNQHAEYIKTLQDILKETHE